MVRQDGEIIEILVALVDAVEHLVAIVLLADDPAGQLADVDVGALLDDGGHARPALGHLLGNGDDVLDPVGVLGEAHLVQIIVIIRMVVDQRHGAQLVVALDEHALGVEIRKAQRAHDRLHPELAAELVDLVHQGLGHLLVLDEVIPAEAHLLVVPLLVGLAVDDGGHAADQLAVLVGKIQLGIAELLRGALLLVQRIHLVEDEGRDIIRVVTIQFLREIDELLELGTGPDRTNLDRHFG